MLNLQLRYPWIHSRTPILGLGVGVLSIVATISLSTHRIFAFFNFEGLLIVGGGVIGIAYMSFDTKEVRKAFQFIATMFTKTDSQAKDHLHRDMMEIIAWAYLVKEKGMRRLETSIAKSGITDPFVRYGLNMVVSGYQPEEVRSMMETAADACHDRDSVPVDILQSMASHAPAFGMIGTLVGMVIMLCRLTGDVSQVGSSLSVAFLSTLYGVLCARLIYMPAAARARQVVADRRLRNQLVIEGMVMLVGDKSPMYIKDRLNSFLRPECHDYVDQFKLTSDHAASAGHLKVVGI